VAQVGDRSIRGHAEREGATLAVGEPGHDDRDDDQHDAGEEGPPHRPRQRRGQRQELEADQAGDEDADPDPPEAVRQRGDGGRRGEAEDAHQREDVPALHEPLGSLEVRVVGPVQAAEQAADGEHRERDDAQVDPAPGSGPSPPRRLPA
jgi:hypothetical protein